MNKLLNSPKHQLSSYNSSSSIIICQAGQHHTLSMRHCHLRDPAGACTGPVAAAAVVACARLRGSHTPYQVAAWAASAASLAAASALAAFAAPFPPWGAPAGGPHPHRTRALPTLPSAAAAGARAAAAADRTAAAGSHTAAVLVAATACVTVVAGAVGVALLPVASHTAEGALAACTAAGTAHTAAAAAVAPYPAAALL